MQRAPARVGVGGQELEQVVQAAHTTDSPAAEGQAPGLGSGFTAGGHEDDLAEADAGLKPLVE